MRISDWSSDVCSSDLKFGEWLTRERIAETSVTPETLQRYAGAELHRRGLSPNSRRVAVSALRGYYAHLQRGGLIPRHPADALPYPRDRNSVVSGKSVSVRVDLGGRRILLTKYIII